MAAIDRDGEPMAEIYGPDGQPVDEDTRFGGVPSEATRRSMRGNRSRDTGPELAVRQRLHAAGLRYRVATRPLPALRRTADIVFSRRQVAVFIDGCFWHRCPIHTSTPRTRREYWQAKFDRNVARDEETNRLLRLAGWTVLRYWEHEDPTTVAAAIISVLDDVG